MVKDHEKFIREVVEMATANVGSGIGGPFAAIVVKEGQIVGRGVNQVTSTNDPTAHAEVVAIRDACKNLNSHQLTDCIIYASCEPCPMCLGAIYWARPGMIVFAAENTDAAKAGFDDSFIYKEVALPIHQRSIPTLNLKPGEFFKPFSSWLENETKKLY